MNKKVIYGLLFCAGLFIGLMFAQSGIKFGKCGCCACGCCSSYGINFPSAVKCECKKPDEIKPKPRPGIGSENPFGEVN